MQNDFSGPAVMKTINLPDFFREPLTRAATRAADAAPAGVACAPIAPKNAPLIAAVPKAEPICKVDESTPEASPASTARLPAARCA
jgi:hypothetical protein